MTALVLDASVVAKGFSPHPERHHDQALDLLDRVADGLVQVLAPSFIVLELLNVAACKWHLDEPALRVLAAAIDDLRLTLPELDHGRVAAWSARGLTVYDAAYVAVAEAADLPLVTDDDDLVRLAPAIAVALGASGDLLVSD